jgi:hypothetical protein
MAAAAIAAPEPAQISWFCPRMVASQAEALIETQVPFRCGSFSGGRRRI